MDDVVAPVRRPIWRKKRFFIVATILAVWFCWPPPRPLQTVLRVAAQADRIEFLSLDSSPPIGSELPNERNFHGYEIVGRTSIDGEDKSVVIGTLWVGTCGIQLLHHRCFRPRHGVRITSGTAIYDLLICFECGGIIMYDGSESLSIDFGGSVTQFNEILRKHDVPLPPQAR